MQRVVVIVMAVIIMILLFANIVYQSISIISIEKSKQSGNNRWFEVENRIMSIEDRVLKVEEHLGYYNYVLEGE